MKIKKKQNLYYENESIEFLDWLKNSSFETQQTGSKKEKENESNYEISAFRFIPKDNHPFFELVERELFYKYYFYSPLEYQQGSRVLYRLINDKYEIWKEKFPNPSDWIQGKWKSMFFQLPEPQQEEELGELSDQICRKCHKKGQVRTITKQIKSFDESGTLFCTCTNPQCGHRWKE